MVLDGRSYINDRFKQRTKRQSDYCKRCANSLLSIINDILDFSKLEAGKMSVENENIDIKQFVEEIIKTHVPRVMEKAYSYTTIFQHQYRNILLVIRKGYARY